MHVSGSDFVPDDTRAVVDTVRARGRYPRPWHVHGHGTGTGTGIYLGS